jgi:hypothetical protein
VEYRFPFALEKLVCVHFPFTFNPSSTSRRMAVSSALPKQGYIRTLGIRQQRLDMSGP